MKSQPNMEHCIAFIHSHSQAPGRTGPYREERQTRAVTLSRQTGSGARLVASELAAWLQSKGPKDAPPWTVFDRNLMEEVLRDHHLPERLAQFLPEDRVSKISDILEDLFGLHPPTWTLVPQVAETILRLVGLGNVIIIGRGANVVTATVPGVVHVRLLASMETRIERLRAAEGITRAEALKLIHAQDRGRERYLRTHFHQNIDDPLLYHLTINMDVISVVHAARLIGETVLSPDAMRILVKRPAVKTEAVEVNAE